MASVRSALRAAGATQSLRAWALLFVAALSFGVNALLTRHEAGETNFWNLLYSSLTPFAASYQPAGNQAQRPSSTMALALTTSFLTTVAALVSAYFTLTRDTWRQWAASQRSGAFLVIGDTVSAEAIAQSARKTYGNDRVVRVLPPSEADPFPFVASAHWPNVTRDKRVARLIENSQSTVVATVSDATNSTLAADIREEFARAQPYFLLASSALSRALRPRVIDEQLPTGGAFSIGDNVAQFVATVIASHARVRSTTVRVALEARGGEQELRKTIVAWLRDADRAQSLITETRDARITVVDRPSEADVLVLVGDPSEVAARVLRGVRKAARTPRMIAVMPPDLLASGPAGLKLVEHAEDWIGTSAGREIPGTLVVDPLQVGLHHRLVTEGTAVVWGRAYHQARAVVTGTDADWNFEEHGLNEQSSIAAAQFMVEQLWEHGFALVQSPQSEAQWNVDPEIVEVLAREMHESWRRREWRHHGRALRVAETGRDGTPRRRNDDIDFDNLVEEAKQNNRRVVAEVYPAMAAMLGYRIRQLPSVGESA